MFEAPFFQNFHFLRPAGFLLLLPFALFSYLQWTRGDLGKAWRGHIAPHLLPHMLLPGNQRKMFSPLWISLLIVPLLTLALAGPSWRRGESPFAIDSSALVIAIDLSESMGNADLQPDRLQRARSKLLELIRRRGEASTALLAYAGSGYSVLPLSDDPELMLHYLDALYVDMLPTAGKAPESILPLATELLADRGGTLLLIADGATENSMEAFQGLRELPNIQLLVWGMGKTQQEQDADQARGISHSAEPIDEDMLRRLAEAGAGNYQRVSADDQDLNEILKQMDRHMELSADSSRPWKDQGYALVPLIMILYLLWFRKGWALRW